jgi:hypothetical protein
VEQFNCIVVYICLASGQLATITISAYHHYRCEFEPRSGGVYSIQHYVIKFVSYLRQAGGFLWVLWFPSPIQLTTAIYPTKRYGDNILDHGPR